ncbi:DUF3347 domain-containing protein [Pedobacter lithocola]|uniref:DUF3347 domain-containing protein n=1 Tax=Pedobacter lithocola TaxID=1908239 RepID=A0ABV8P6C6_9SPHI
MKRILGVTILASLMACNQSEKKSTDLKDSNTVSVATKTNKVVIKDAKKEQIFLQYENLKNALVQSDSSDAQKAAKELQNSLANFEGCETTASIAKNIADTNDLVAQRKDFTALSMDLIAFVKADEIEQGTIYVQRCPMANNGDGGDWLSTEKEIKNPYYGKEMLECGRVTEEIKAK